MKCFVKFSVWTTVEAKDGEEAIHLVETSLKTYLPSHYELEFEISAEEPAKLTNSPPPI